MRAQPELESLVGSARPGHEHLALQLYQSSGNRAQTPIHTVKTKEHRRATMKLPVSVGYFKIWQKL